MRILLQRVTRASVTVDDRLVGQIGRGYLLLLCAMKGDTTKEADWLAEKVAGLRLFDAEDGKVNDKSLLDIGGEALVVSQFTLSADISNGRRPDYTAAAAPAEAQELYTYFIQKLRDQGVKNVQSGEFAAYMQITLQNDGPVTLFLERKA
jgi:D-tyrosyl-tRNA(Tyr) deacylase